MQTNKNSLNNLKLGSKIKKTCVFCQKEYTVSNIAKHEHSCKSNPANQKECPVCKTMHGKDGITCSYACSNKMFRSGENNGNWKQDTYQTTCWLYHGRKCLVCGEEKIVAAHHVNENHNDNRPENLVPLCPTHHQYIHSRYKNEVLPIVEEYVSKFQQRVREPGFIP